MKALLIFLPNDLEDCEPAHTFVADTCRPTSVVYSNFGV